MRLTVERMGWGALGVLVVALSSCGIVAGLDDFTDNTSTGGSGGGNGGAGGCGDLQTDEDNCGECGRGCAEGYLCEAGQCGNEIVDVASGDNHSCVVLRNGEVWCWGGNDYGQLGHAPGTAAPNLNGENDVVCDVNVPTSYCQPKPSRVPFVTDALDVEIGNRVTCVIGKGGKVQCWGRNAEQHWLLGTKGIPKCNNHDTMTECTHLPQTIAFAQTVEIAQLAVGLESACARTNKGDVYCWGFDGYGGLGQGMLVPWSGTALPIKSSDLLGKVIDLSVSRAFGHACALRSDGTIWCWGTNGYGQLGHVHGGATDDLMDCGGVSFLCNPTPSQAFASITMPKFASVRLGHQYSCAMAENKSVWCWGANHAGILGNAMPPDNDVHAAPTVVSSISADAIAGYHFTMYALDDGRLSGWGWNGYGAIGSGADDGVPCIGLAGSCQSSAKMTAMPAGVHVVKMAAGFAGGLAVDAQNKVWAWGINASGELGFPPSMGASALSPVQVKGLPE